MERLVSSHGKATVLTAAQDRCPNIDRLSEIQGAESPIMLSPNRVAKGTICVPHHHECGQLIYPLNGRVRVRAENQVWGGSPHQAVWVPPGTVHTGEALDDIIVHNCYIRTGEIEGMPSNCKAIVVSPLLRELLSYAATLPRQYTDVTEHTRTMLSVVDQIRMAEDVMTLHLPLSEDRRLKPILTWLLDHPDDNRSLEEWAEFAHTSARTLARLFMRETGLSFRQWRQQLRIMEGIMRLGDGESVLTVSMDLGYASQSAYTSMFRRCLGSTPSQFRRKA